MAVSIEKKQATATVKINDEEEKVEGVLEPVEGLVGVKLTKVGDLLEVLPMANVGIKVGMTKNLGNYESLRVDLSLFMPTETSEEALDEAFDFVQNWCDLKMQSIMKELEE